MTALFSWTGNCSATLAVGERSTSALPTPVTTASAGEPPPPLQAAKASGRSAQTSWIDFFM
jgi:hypothetical protein